MKKINFKYILFFACLFLAVIEPLYAGQPKILILNSNSEIEKYKIVQEEFKKTISNPFRDVDLGDIDRQYNMLSELKEYKADIIYCIGAKACSFANKHFDSPLVFSSIINWQRMSLPSAAYGVSNELNARMPIFMFRSIFPKIKKIGILYSKEYTLQWFNETRVQANELEINILGMAVSKNRAVRGLNEIINDIDALWLIPDPLVISEKKYLYEILDQCDKKKVPVFSYHNAFVNLGAVMSVSVDDPTIGRQAAGIVTELIAGETPSDKVQFPAGSNISLNLKKVKEYNLEYNRDSLGLVNNILK